MNVRSTPTLQRSGRVAGCHGNLGRNVTLTACGDSARKPQGSPHRHGDPLPAGAPAALAAVIILAEASLVGTTTGGRDLDEKAEAVSLARTFFW
ncbi:MAG: hypothetical protein GEV13_24160 [Rhodospirillales bacterium]|nr:hypothetical protein [Rhodospirillales bacterium]